MLEGQLEATVGGGVEFHFHVTNADDEPITLLFRDAGKADVAVFDDDEVWRWSVGRMFAQSLQEATLQPGESATIEMTWETPQSGTYTARAELNTEEECTAETTFSVE